MVMGREEQRGREREGVRVRVRLRERERELFGCCQNCCVSVTSWIHVNDDLALTT